MINIIFKKSKLLFNNIFQTDRLYLNFLNWKYKLNLDYKLNISQLHILKEVFYHKAYEIGFPKKEKNAVVVDIGAHYGYFSIFATKHCKTPCKLFSIEPSVSNFLAMQANLNSSKIHHIQTLNIGISGTTGIRTLFQSKPQNHSIFSHYINGMNEETQVHCLSLKDFIDDNNIEKIDFLKIDCEGAEHEIIQNTDFETLQKCTVISMEIHDMQHCGFNSDRTISNLINAGFEVLFQDYDVKKSKPMYNAKMVFKLAKIK